MQAKKYKMESSYSPLGDDTNEVLQFLSNYHWVRNDVDATAEIVTRRIQSLVDGWKRDNIWEFSTPIQVEEEEEEQEEESLQDNKIQGDARKYQTLMADIAKQRNCIVTLGTGMGKTLIAMMTIRHFRTTCPKKQTWFLVPTVALAVQQADTLKMNLPYSVGIAINTAISSDTARDTLSKVDILVATHGSALNLLRHYGDKFTFLKVNLLVLDECHNATKQHNYAVIMDKFYHTLPLAKEDRPHILGLTASPIINIENQVQPATLESMLYEIEHKLNAQLISLSSLGIPQEESGVIECKVEERVIYYANGDVSWPTIATVEMHKIRLKEMKQVKYLYEEFGPLLVSRYCQVLVVELSQNRYDEESDKQYQALIRYLNAVIEYCVQSIHNQTIPAVSHKLLQLENVLFELLNPSTEKGAQESIGIVFVERRITAVALKHYLATSTSKLQLKCDMLTASSTNIFKYLHYHSQSHQEAQQAAHDNWLHVMKDTRSVLTKLRRKELDILISTSLIEEGVDVAACSFVIVLDDLKTTKSYIQCKGRARQLSAKFIVFEDARKKPSVTLAHARTMESHVKDYIGSRVSVQPVRDEPPQENEILDSSMEIQALEAGEYRTHLAMVDLSSSKNVINRYILSIPRDSSARSSRRAMSPYLPVYGDCTLKLPSHLPQHVRYIHLPRQYCFSSKVENEARLALIACVRLHQIEAINDRLLPLSRDDFMKRILADIRPTFTQPWTENDSQTLDSDNVSSHDGFIYPIMYESEGFQSYDTLLRSEGRTLGFFSFRELQTSVDFATCHAQFGKVSCRIKQEDMKKVIMDDTQWAICTSFYEVLFNARWRRRTGRKRFLFQDDVLMRAKHDKPYPLYIVVSLTNQGGLDWDRMQTVIREYHQSETERRDAVQNWRQGTPPRLWAPIYSPNTTYVAFHPSGSKTCSESFPNAMFQTYSDYFLQKYGVCITLDCQLMEAHLLWDLPKALNTADEIENIDVPKIVVLPKDGCLEAPIADASLLLHTTFLPQVLYCVERNETVCKFLDYCSKYIPPLAGHLTTIPFKRIMEALTAKSCSLPFNYDRLEYLGDAVLKLIQTDSLLYSTNERLTQWLKCLHEGDLSALRSAMGCNERLQEAAKKNGIDRFILVTPLDRSLWLPPFLKSYILDTNDTDEKEMFERLKPSNNVQADVIEALLGLIYLHHSFDIATQTAEVLGLAFPKQERQFRTNHRTSSSPYVGCITNFLGSQIENEVLLEEALTHPTVINTNVPNYQRMEWLGDAVLCLSAREWLCKQFYKMAVKDLVLLEATLVSNEALAWLGFRSGIHRWINHCDPTFPGRFEEYHDHINDKNTGIWGTRPPKVLADVVEALIGAIHSDGGFSAGQRCVLHIMRSMTSALLKKYETDERCHYTLMQPQQLLMQLCSSVKIRAVAEEGYTGKELWLGTSQGWSRRQTNMLVGIVSFHGTELLASGDGKSSRQTAKLRASSILANIFLKHPNIVHELMQVSLSLSLQKRDKGPKEAKNNNNK